MATVTFRPRAGTDDGYASEHGGNDFNNGLDFLLLNDISSSNYDGRVWVRLIADSGFTLAPKTQIERAYLYLTKRGGASHSARYKVTFANQDDPPVVSGKSDFDSRSKFSPQVVTPDYWSTDETQRVDVTSLVQQVVNRPGFSGQRMVLFLLPGVSGWNGDNNNYQFYAYDSSPSKAPRVEVTIRTSATGRATAPTPSAAGTGRVTNPESDASGSAAAPTPSARGVASSDRQQLSAQGGATAATPSATGTGRVGLSEPFGQYLVEAVDGAQVSLYPYAFRTDAPRQPGRYRYLPVEHAVLSTLTDPAPGALALLQEAPEIPGASADGFVDLHYTDGRSGDLTLLGVREQAGGSETLLRLTSTGTLEVRVVSEGVTVAQTQTALPVLGAGETGSVRVQLRGTRLRLSRGGSELLNVAAPQDTLAAEGLRVGDAQVTQLSVYRHSVAYQEGAGVAQAPAPSALGRGESTVPSVSAAGVAQAPTPSVTGRSFTSDIPIFDQGAGQLADYETLGQAYEAGQSYYEAVRQDCFGGLHELFAASYPGASTDIQELFAVIAWELCKVRAEIARMTWLRRAERMPPQFIRPLAEMFGVPNFPDTAFPEEQRRFVALSLEALKYKGSRYGLELILKSLLPFDQLDVALTYRYGLRSYWPNNDYTGGRSFWRGNVDRQNDRARGLVVDSLSFGPRSQPNGILITVQKGGARTQRVIQGALDKALPLIEAFVPHNTAYRVRIVDAPVRGQNLLRYSESFGNPAWERRGAWQRGNLVIDPSPRWVGYLAQVVVDETETETFSARVGVKRSGSPAFPAVELALSYPQRWPTVSLEGAPPGGYSRVPALFDAPPEATGSVSFARPGEHVLHPRVVLNAQTGAVVAKTFDAPVSVRAEAESWEVSFSVPRGGTQQAELRLYPAFNQGDDARPATGESTFVRAQVVAGALQSYSTTVHSPNKERP